MIRIEWRRGPHRTGSVELVGALGLLAPLVAWAFPYLPWLQRAWPGCSFRAVTGYPCGGCGFTRAFVRSAHGNVGDALAVSPLGTALFFLWIFAGIVIVATWLLPSLPRPVPRLAGRLGTWASRVGVAAIFLANWAYLLWRTFRDGAPPG